MTTPRPTRPSKNKGAVKTARPSLDEYFMALAMTAATRATCRHRDQGAVIVKDKRVISMGYNGAPSGVKDCLERQYCSKAEGLPCLAESLHGEANAIISAAKHGVGVDGATLYCVYAPCRGCCHMIKNAGIAEVKYLEPYESFPESPGYLEELGIAVEKLQNEVENVMNSKEPPSLITGIPKLLFMQQRLMEEVPHEMRREVYFKALAAKETISLLLVYLNSLGHKPWRPNPLSEEAQDKALREFTSASFVVGLTPGQIGMWLERRGIKAVLDRELISGLGVIEETIEHLEALAYKTKAEQLEEITDILFFYLELTLLGGFTWAEIEEEYVRKWAVNMERYERAKKGDFGWDDREKKEGL